VLLQRSQGADSVDISASGFLDCLNNREKVSVLRLLVIVASRVLGGIVYLAASEDAQIALR
jgi:hypothetical protein